MVKELITFLLRKRLKPKPGRRAYIIYAPNYDHRSAGRRVLHKLCHLLNEAGETAYIYRNRVNWHWTTPRIGIWQAKKLIKQGAIVVYPEKVFGNPLQASRVVRYILNTPGIHGGPKTYDPQEIKFYFSESLIPPGVSHKMTLPIPAIDTRVFYRNPAVKKDIEYLVYFGKHKPIPGYHPKQVIGIAKPSRQLVLGTMLRRAKKLITYDTLTALAFEATLCGCPVIIIPDGIRTKEQIANSEFGFNGMAWGQSQEEWEKALKTLDQAPQALEKVTNQAKQALVNFIAITQLT